MRAKPATMSPPPLGPGPRWRAARAGPGPPDDDNSDDWNRDANVDESDDWFDADEDLDEQNLRERERRIY